MEVSCNHLKHRCFNRGRNVYGTNIEGSCCLIMFDLGTCIQVPQIYGSARVWIYSELLWNNAVLWCIMNLSKTSRTGWFHCIRKAVVRWSWGNLALPSALLSLTLFAKALMSVSCSKPAVFSTTIWTSWTFPQKRTPDKSELWAHIVVWSFTK